MRQIPKAAIKAAITFCGAFLSASLACFGATASVQKEAPAELVHPGQHADRHLSGADAGTPRHWGVLDQYCVKCHNTEDWAGGVAFDALSVSDIPEEAHTWEKAVRMLRTGMMPPAGKPRPQRAVLDGFASELAARLDHASALHPNPGTKSLHRLNRTEYANAIRDILAYDIDVSTLLPADDAAEGFDNIADVLNVSPTLVQSYVAAAMKISRWVVGDRSMAPTTVKYAAPPGLSQKEHVDGLPLGSRGGLLVTHNFPLDAEYEFRVSTGTFRLAGPTGGPPPRVDVMLNGEQVKVADPRKFRLRVKAGPQRLGIALVEQRHWAGIDELYSKARARPNDFENVVINGPFDATGLGDTPSRHAIFVCDPKDASREEHCAREILAHLATRAFRRPVQQSDAAVDALMQFYQSGRRSGNFETGIQEGVARLLVDPRFLYRIEAEPTDVADGSIYRISDIELASRLSFFLWSSVPDETLIRVASEGHLTDTRVLEQQVRRMLADPRSRALVDNFAGQWLRLRELRTAQPEDKGFDENLRRAFERETELLFANIIHEDRSLIELLDADYTFVNERLAGHYGIPNVHDSYMRRVSLPKDSPRRGLLGKGSVLTVTSAANRTSPVMRGAWVMESLLGAPVPQPPPGVDVDLKEDPSLARPMTVRQRLEKHRANPACAACHQIMDPIGFSLENFDSVGRWREFDGPTPVDASGKLVDGTPLAGVQDLRRALLDQSESFFTTATEKLLTYALGRRLEDYDQPVVRKIVRDAGRDGYRFSSIVLGIVNSLPFQMRVKGAATGEKTHAGLHQAGL